ncbi:MAG TPA: DUF5666 domain-containing protein [Nitrosopumilaceae archaeon]|nr:DUF5666 domain-containing protein [Nitrosopumilaceae archaeon]
MIVSLNAIFLMAVLLLGLAGYPSSQLNSENNVDINSNFLLSFANIAHADEDEDDENEDEHEDEEEENEHEDENEEEEHEDEEDAMEDAADAIEDANEEIDKAQAKIDEASDEGKETMLAQEQLDEAMEILEMAQQSFDLGDFEEAEKLAEEAEDLANEARGKLVGKTQEDLEEEDEDELEFEGIIDTIGSNSFTLEGFLEEIFVNDETEFDEGFDSLGDLMPGFHVDVDVILSDSSLVATEIEVEEELEDEDEDEEISHVLENQEKATQKAQDLINELLQKIEELENRVQTLLEKLESGEYFGTLPHVDSEVNSYVISFEGTAISIENDSIVTNVEGEIFIENLLTIGDDVSKFRVTGGEISIDDTFYDIVFGKARVSSSGTSGENDSVILIGQVINFGDVTDDTSTIKLVIDAETSLEGDFGAEPIIIEILPQSKIAGQWHLSGLGQLSIV